MWFGRQAPIDPEAWVIVDGKLFLGGASKAIEFFTSAETDRMAQADANWERLGQTEQALRRAGAGSGGCWARRSGERRKSTRPWRGQTIGGAAIRATSL